MSGALIIMYIQFSTAQRFDSTIVPVDM